MTNSEENTHIVIFEAIKEKSNTLLEQKLWYDKLKYKWEAKQSAFSRKINGHSPINKLEKRLAFELLELK